MSLSSGCRYIELSSRVEQNENIDEMLEDIIKEVRKLGNQELTRVVQRKSRDAGQSPARRKVKRRVSAADRCRQIFRKAVKTSVEF